MGRTRVRRCGTGRALSPLVLIALGCAGAATPQAPKAAARTLAAPSFASDRGELFDFPDATQSPLGVAEVPPALVPFFSQCKRGDAALSRLAERFARRQSEGHAPLDASEISFALRAQGSPYMWPRTWTLEGEDFSGSAAVEQLRGWLDSWHDGGERRCGFALVSSHKRSVLGAVAVDALADLEPLPVRTRAGSWVDVDAELLVASSETKLVVLGPSGAPFTVPTSFDGRRASARFHADRPGAFLVQLLANVAGGPRPVLEATVYADVRPPTAFVSDAAPGEPNERAAASSDPTQDLLRLVNEARQSEQSPPLVRDAALDAVAARHAEAMRALKRIAHDAGDGDPESRVEAASLNVLAAGENVAHALDAVQAHRVLWASPSHRENLLEPRYDKIGIGIARDSDGSLWVCEVFADFPNQSAAPR
jgi:uncharacterized protein YkwD